MYKRKIIDHHWTIKNICSKECQAQLHSKCVKIRKVMNQILGEDVAKFARIVIRQYDKLEE